MKKEIYLIILVLTCKICDAQNLVPNGDFEQDSLCPFAASQLYDALYWINPATNIYNISGTPDYFNACCGNPSSVGVPVNITYGYQQAHSGVAYAGIELWRVPVFYPNYREYIEAHLTSSLIANTCYHFQMYVNLANFSFNTSDAIGVYFSNVPVTGINNWSPLPFNSQINYIGNVFDSLNWTLVNGNYTAQGGENFLIIGNFKNDSNTYVIPSGIQTGYGTVYVYIDDVCLTPCGSSCSTGIEVQNEKKAIILYPNPFSDKINITVQENGTIEVILFDFMARKLFSQSFKNSTSINTKQLAKGIYLYEVRNKNGVIRNGKVVKE